MDLEKLKTARKQKKITYKELSARSGIPERTIYGIFMGHTPTPRIDTLEAIEKALGLDNDGITIIKRVELSDKENRLLSSFNALIPPMQDYVIEMIEKLTEQEQNVIQGV